MKKSKGQAVLEYILLVVMLAVTMAIIIRNTNRTIYDFWTQMTRQIAAACPDCDTPPGPRL